MDESEQLLLWRWSTLVQVTSMAMVVAFFALLSRANPRVELWWWTRAWLANFLALAVTTVYWLLQWDAIFPVVTTLYVGAKATFLLLLFEGAWAMVRPGERLFSTRAIAAGNAVFAVAAGVLLGDLNSVGITVHSLMGAALVVFAVVLAKANAEGSAWLIAGIAIRGTLALTEAAAYIVQLRGPSDAMADWVAPAGAFLASSSSFDSGAEWLLVLGCVLAVSDRGRRELQGANRDLLAAQEDLRRLADRDPLTGAINRRALRDILTAVQPVGAMLLFFDLDRFKLINDMHGHAAGDTCLKLFATALKESFRPSDHVVRYGGDEFLVVARGLDSSAARARVEDVNTRMRTSRLRGIVCGFSVGMSKLAPGGQPEVALGTADENMYKAKGQKRE